jgi:Fe-Mn family superoxide dismutase
MPIELPPLPYAKDALAPHVSAETIDYHYGKHHQAYVTNLNNLIAGTANANKTLEEIVKTSDGALFNNAAQVWNHTFYWHCLSPKGGGSPTGKVLEQVNASFGSVADFKQKFKEAAVSQFGSGWAWVVKDGQKLAITKTANADLPMKHGQAAVLTCDVWEHAYYIDYRNARPKYLDVFLDKLINWDFMAKNL